MTNGFIIRELTLTGLDVEPATVHFRRGLNIISGPSNTGKSYIFQCINYMLGGSKQPKAIKESKNYLYCYLELEDLSGKHYTLKSDLKGGNFYLFESTITAALNSRDYKLLERKHSEDRENNVSRFLLSLCGIENKKLKKNEKGQKANLSFRHIVKLTLVDETRIITDQSPILSGEYITATVEKSLFRYLLTGIDDSDIIEKLTEKEITHRKGKLELLTELIGGIDNDIQNLGEYENDRLQRVEVNIHSYNNELSSLSEINRELNFKRSIHSEKLLALREEQSELHGLFARSEILNKQYESDSARLHSTIEACTLLGDEELPETECPFCHQKFDDKFNTQDAENILRACAAELAKIDKLKTELVFTQNIMQSEISRFEQNISQSIAEINQIDVEIEQKVQSNIRLIVDNLSQLQGIKDQLTKHMGLIERRKALVESKEFIARSIPAKKRDDNTANSLSSIIFPLTEEMQAILKACKYSESPNVSFNEAKMDFLISGEDRELAGKGYRAITYSSFVIALQRLMANKSYALGTAILDSPFVTYRKPEAGSEGIPIDIAMDFYRYLANSSIPQVIVLENEEPPVDIDDHVHHIIFTRSLSVGRYGFIPIA